MTYSKTAARWIERKYTPSHRGAVGSNWATKQLRVEHTRARLAACLRSSDHREARGEGDRSVGGRAQLGTRRNRQRRVDISDQLSRRRQNSPIPVGRTTQLHRRDYLQARHMTSYVRTQAVAKRRASHLSSINVESSSQSRNTRTRSQSTTIQLRLRMDSAH